MNRFTEYNRNIQKSEYIPIFYNKLMMMDILNLSLEQIKGLDIYELSSASHYCKTVYSLRVMKYQKKTKKGISDSDTNPDYDPGNEIDPDFVSEV